MYCKTGITIGAYTLLEAARNRFMWLVLAGLAFCWLLAEFAASLAVTEVANIGASSYAFLARIMLVLLFALFVSISLQQDYDDRRTELYLSLPCQRAVYLLGRFGGYAVLAVVISLLSATVLLFYTSTINAATWGSVLAAELVIVIAFCLFCSMALLNATNAFSITMAFYLLSRIMSDLVLLGQSPVMVTDSVALEVTTMIMSGIALLLPDLDRFASSELALYGISVSAYGGIMVQTGIYVVLLLAAATFDFYRRDF